MGSASRVLLVGATSLIVGVYAVSLKGTQTNDLTAAISTLNRVQTERIEDAAVRGALDRIVRAPYYGRYNMAGSITALGGGSYYVNYTTYTTYGYATITYYPPTGDTKTLDVRYDKMSTTKPGFRHMTRGQWQSTRLHVEPVHN